MKTMDNPARIVVEESELGEMQINQFDQLG
jgi:hypothetical protein